MIAPNPNIAATVKRYYLSNIRKRGPENPTRGANWAQVDKALHGEVSDYILPEDRDLEPMTADDAKDRIKVWSGWRPIYNELLRLERERDKAKVRAENAAPVRPEATQAETFNPYRIERIATGYQVFCNSTPMQKYETWPAANEEYERLSAELRDQRMRTRAAGQAPTFPWAACAWEMTLAEHGLVDDDMRAALLRIGPNMSLYARQNRQAVAEKIWERIYPPIWATGDAKGEAQYAAQNATLAEVLRGTKAVPQGWIDGCTSGLDQWREFEAMGMGGVTSMYVAFTPDGGKLHFDTKEGRDAWMADNPGSYA